MGAKHVLTASPDAQEAVFEQTALQIVIELLLDEVRYGSAFGFQPGVGDAGCFEGAVGLLEDVAEGRHDRD